MVMVIGLVMTSRLLGNMDDLHGASGHHEGDGDVGDGEDKSDGDIEVMTSAMVMMMASTVPVMTAETAILKMGAATVSLASLQ